MRRLAIIIAAIALLLGSALYFQNATIRQLRTDNAALVARMSNTSQRALLASKAACTDRAERVFRLLGYSENSNGGASGLDAETFTNHYSVKLKRCLMTVEITNWQNAHEVISKFLMDADERKTFGQMVWVSSDTKKFYEQKPMQCSMTPPDAPEGICETTEQYDEFVKSYMTT